MKECIRCHTRKPLEEFYRHPQMADGHLNKCKGCAKDDARRRHKSLMATPAGRTAERKRGRDKYERLYAGKQPTEAQRRAHRKAERTWRRENRLKVAAHSIVARALKAGILVKPKHCQRCPKGGRLEAHHDDYSKPLDVEWLCRKCHAGESRKD